MRLDRNDLRLGRERLRQRALRKRNAFNYYRLCDIMGINDIEDFDLYNEGQQLDDDIAIQYLDIESERRLK